MEQAPEHVAIKPQEREPINMWEMPEVLRHISMPIKEYFIRRRSSFWFLQLPVRLKRIWQVHKTAKSNISASMLIKEAESPKTIKLAVNPRYDHICSIKDAWRGGGCCGEGKSPTREPEAFEKS